MIVSFGYATGTPIPRAAKVFDVRDLTHAEHDPAFSAKREEIAEYVRAHPHETVAIGCQKGQHRSYRLAEDLARALRVSVHHRDK